MFRASWCSLMDEHALIWGVGKQLRLKFQNIWCILNKILSQVTWLLRKIEKKAAKRHINGARYAEAVLTFTPMRQDIKYPPPFFFTLSLNLLGLRGYHMKLTHTVLCTGRCLGHTSLCLLNFTPCPSSCNAMFSSFPFPNHWPSPLEHCRSLVASGIHGPLGFLCFFCFWESKRCFGNIF